MSDTSVYKEQLLQHYRHPHNRQDQPMTDADVVRRGANPRCGDEIEVGLYLDGNTINEVRFRGRGCSVCIASSSMMAEAVSGQDHADVVTLCEGMRGWFEQGEGTALEEPPASLAPLAAVREYPARKRCVLLSWEALADALEAV